MMPLFPALTSVSTCPSAVNVSPGVTAITIGAVFVAKELVGLGPTTSYEVAVAVPETGLPHPHMLRHACGYALANKGQDTRAIQGWLGYRSITSTAVYTALAPNRFKDFWRE
jgi:site-specific recombinase XerD